MASDSRRAAYALTASTGDFSTGAFVSIEPLVLGRKFARRSLFSPLSVTVGPRSGYASFDNLDEIPLGPPPFVQCFYPIVPAYSNFNIVSPSKMTIEAQLGQRVFAEDDGLQSEVERNSCSAVRVLRSGNVYDGAVVLC